MSTTSAAHQAGPRKCLTLRSGAGELYWRPALNGEGFRWSRGSKDGRYHALGIASGSESSLPNAVVLVCGYRGDTRMMVGRGIFLMSASTTDGATDNTTWDLTLTPRTIFHRSAGIPGFEPREIISRFIWIIPQLWVRRDHASRILHVDVGLLDATGPRDRRRSIRSVSRDRKKLRGFSISIASGISSGNPMTTTTVLRRLDRATVSERDLKLMLAIDVPDFGCTATSRIPSFRPGG